MNDSSLRMVPRQDLARTVLAVLLILVLAAASLWVLRPFLLAAVWAVMIVVATWPFMLLVQRRLRRRALAVTIMTCAMLVVFVAPVLLTIQTLLASTDQVVAWVKSLSSVSLPGPPEWVSGIPIVGAKIALRWTELAAASQEDLASRLSPYLTDALQWGAGAAGSLGGLVVQFLLIVIVAAILYANGESARETLIAFGRRLAGERGEAVVLLAGRAIRAVALGVVVTALVQTVLAGIGLAVAGVPFAGLLSAVILILCIAQLGPILVLAPAVVWLFWTGRTGMATALLVWTVLVGTLDNVLRPLLIRRGADLPLLLIFAGVIGGLIAFGIIGLFVGPVVLAVAATLLTEWMREGRAPPSEEGTPR
jgi:predicted PurR-regulated permease PerM